MLGREDLRILIFCQARMGAGHFQHYVGKLFDAVRAAAANVVSLARLEVIYNVRQRSDRILQISGRT